MAKKTEKKNQGGRPLSYSPELVHAVIAKSIQDGMPIGNIGVDFVKKQLCEHHGVSDSIRKESLEDLVDPILEEFAEEERRTLLKGLPNGIASSVDEAVLAAGRELLLLVARQNAACKAAADLECSELRADKRNAMFRLVEVEAALKEEQDANRKLTQERDEATAQLAVAREQLRMARAEVERLGRDAGALDRLLAELRNPAVRDDIRAALTEIMPQSEARAS